MKDIKQTRFILLIIGAVAVFGLSACSSVHEARITIAQADSLLVAGEVYEDSTSLARAVNTLTPWRRVAPTDYAKACFYYGRLLRTRTFYADAMRQLIAARHSRTSDGELLGRVYSNIAYICRLEGNYPLAHDMYVCSSQCFAQAADTLRYLIAQTNIAYALAELGDTSGVRALIEPIRAADMPAGVEDMCLETYAEAYMRAGDYVQAMRYASSVSELSPSVRMIMAQCWSETGQVDSASYHARLVVEQTNHPFLLANALFILAHQDTTACLTDVRNASAQRSIVLEHIADNQGDLSHAVEILQQDMNGKTQRWRMPVIGIVCLIIALIVWWCIIRRHHKRAIEQIAHERQQADEFISAREEQSAQLQEQLSAQRLHIEQEVARNLDALRQSAGWRQSVGWNDYEQFCNVVNRQFFFLADKLKATGQLSEKELRLCVLVLMDCFDSRQQAALLHYGESGVRNLKQHAANKLGTTSRLLREQLMKLMTGEAV
ncbi:MAG: hypothetical protein IJT12_08545 [Paludibacteraceae bacterium]|nr:hypothetical protein [Paludibacteraceae bacterium]